MCVCDLQSSEPEVFVFACGLTDIRGLTFDREGRNLPQFQNVAWTRLAAVASDTDSLATHALDPDLARSQLASRGLYVGRGAMQ